jgi:hypothetical protein
MDLEHDLHESPFMPCPIGRRVRVGAFKQQGNIAASSTLIDLALHASDLIRLLEVKEQLAWLCQEYLGCF